jgi:EmrB/QacA subfamily drug resistance transporter
MPSGSGWARPRSARMGPVSQRVAVSVVFVMAMFMAIMDSTIVNVAVPTLARDLHVRTTNVDAVVVSFLVSLAVFIPASGWLGDRFGTKRVLLAAIVLFTAASALCGLAQSITQLVLFRVLQGAGGGMLTPVGMAMLFRTFPPAERIRASRILIVPTALAPALGPIVGGALVTELTWRWVFYVNVPIGILALCFGAIFLDEHREASPGRFDAAGFVLSGAGLGCVMFALSEGPALGWSSPAIAVTGAGGAALLAALIRIELSVREPMIDLRLFADRLFRVCTLVIFFSTMTFLGVLYAVPLFFQDGLGASALVSGLSTFPEAIGVMLGAQIAARLYPRLGPRRIVAAGLCGIAVCTVLMAVVDAGPAALWEMRGLLFLLGYCMGHVFAPCQAAAFATISSAATGRASTLYNATRQLGSAVGVAVLSTVMDAAGTVRAAGSALQPNLGAYHLAFLTASGTALVAGAIALTIRDRDAASTMQRADGPPAGARHFHSCREVVGC